MMTVLETRSLTKTFGPVTALDRVTLAIPEQSVVGLIGRNGSGKTTLLQHFTGLLLPSGGECFTLGHPCGDLQPEHLSQIGVVHQESRFLNWMRVAQHLRYVASFYDRWDRDLQERLLRELDLDPRAQVGTLSPGNLQKLALILAVCHHPRVLLLDEPAAALDPIAREHLLQFLLQRLQEDTQTLVISSHVLRDVERVVDWVLCLDRGRLLVNSALDELQERYAEWIITARAGGLPARFDERFVLSQQVNGQQARLLVRQAGDLLEAFRERHQVEVVSRPLNLERLFPLLLEEEPS